MNVPEKFKGDRVVELENWSTCYRESSFFTPPEFACLRLCGVVKNHPRKEDGKEVVTSKVLEVHGLYIKTLNNVYKLGTPDPNFLVWLEKQGKKLNPINPVSIKIHNADLV